MPVIITVAPPTGNATTDMARIDAAIQQAHQSYLATGQQAEVHLGAGTYMVRGDTGNPSQGGIELKSGVALIGQGMFDGSNGTSIKLVDNFNARINGIVRTELETVTNVRIANLTIDGNRANNTDFQTGFICGIKEDGSGRTQSNISVSGVEFKNCTNYGFNPHERTSNVTIENSISHGNGVDGFVADYIIGGIYRNNLAYDNDRHGFNIQNASSNLLLENNEAYGNGSAGLTVQRGNIVPNGHTTIPWVTNIDVVGGSYHGNAREGILIKLSDEISITGVQVYGNGRQGVRIEGSTDTVVENSTIFNNSQETHGAYDEVQIRVRLDVDVTGLTYQSTGTLIQNNTIYSDGAIRSRYGVYEYPDVEGVNLVSNTTVTGTVNGASYFAPQLVIPAANQAATSGAAFAYTLAPGSFVDGDGAFTLSARLSSGGPLPSWLTFNPATRSFSGTPTSNATYQVVVEAIDAQGLKDNTAFSLVVSGGTPPTTINGDSNNNTLVGGAGPENIFGMGGSDSLAGNGGADLLDGGSGTDTATYAASPAGVFVNLATGSASGGHADGDTLTSIENLTGSAHADQLTGNTGANTIDGGGGADLMTGDNGNDTYVVDDAGDTVVEIDNLGLGGIDTVRSTVNYALGTNLENLVLLGAANINGTGNGKANLLTGNSGNNILDGGLGSDTLTGLAGDDTYIVNVTSDVVVEASGGGTDTIQTLASRTLESNVENMTLLGIAAINATGNSLANVLTGNDAINTLTGNDGDDTLLGFGSNDILRGGNGADTLDGGTGADVMEGGNGNDLYHVDDAGDVAKESSSSGGTDTVRSSVTFALGSNVENLTLTGSAAINGTGTSAVNILIGNDGANTLSGLAGNDSLQGGNEDDRLIGGTGNDSLDGGIGNDTAVFAGDLATYVITTSAGTIQIRDNNTGADGNDGTDTLIGVETAEFKGGATINLLPPIVLDLDGDGIELVDLADSSAMFDFSGIGEGTRTGWVGSDDGMLVFDRNGDGTVSNAGELSFSHDRSGALSDLDGLRVFDSNEDGLFSSADDKFSAFLVWNDANGDGSSDAGELRSLTAAGIEAIVLDANPTERDWASGENIVVNEGSFLWADGRSGAMADVALLHDPFHLAYVNSMIIL